MTPKSISEVVDVASKAKYRQLRVFPSCHESRKLSFSLSCPFVVPFSSWCLHKVVMFKSASLFRVIIIQYFVPSHLFVLCVLSLANSKATVQKDDQTSEGT